MKKIVLFIVLIALSFSQLEGNTKLSYTFTNDFSDDDIATIHFLVAQEKKIFEVKVDLDKKRILVETRGSVDPKIISVILAKTGFGFTLKTKNLAKTSTSNSQVYIR